MDLNLSLAFANVSRFVFCVLRIAAGDALDPLLHQVAEVVPPKEGESVEEGVVLGTVRAGLRDEEQAIR